jgi:hypothetical protein
VESNNAWGFILGGGTFVTDNVHILGVYMENNPEASSGTSTVGGNILVKGKYNNCSINDSYLVYGAKAGATGYCFYIDNAPEAYEVFRESGNQTIAAGAGTNTLLYGTLNERLHRNGAAGTFRNVKLSTNGLARWLVSANDTAEAGSNAGSNFEIRRYNDAGTLLDIPFGINRASGTVTLTAATSALMKWNRGANLMGFEIGASASDGLGLYDYAASAWQWNARGGKFRIGGVVGASAFGVTGIPTSAAGLSSGDVWSNGGVLTIVA